LSKTDLGQNLAELRKSHASGKFKDDRRFTMITVLSAEQDFKGKPKEPMNKRMSM